MGAYVRLRSELSVPIAIPRAIDVGGFATITYLSERKPQMRYRPRSSAWAGGTAELPRSIRSPFAMTGRIAVTVTPAAGRPSVPRTVPVIAPPRGLTSEMLRFAPAARTRGTPDRPGCFAPYAIER